MTDLKTFIASQQALRQGRADQQVDWPRRKEKWLLELKDLWSFITRELLDAGIPSEQMQMTDHRIYEETLGSYVAQGLKVDIGLGWITFVPIGSVIIGGYGRVDVKGSTSKEVAKLIVDDANEQSEEEDRTPSYERDWSWSVYPEQGSRKHYPLDKEGLTRLLETVLK